MRHIFQFILSFSLLLALISGECGYNVCHKSDTKKLNIHLIAHSHDDVGWGLSADNYYDFWTRTIITSVVKALEANKDRRFTQVEMYFFNRWWREQNKQTQDVVQILVQNGQLVFSNGGWTVNDEGAAHYNNIIDQMTLGLKFLNETFGECGHPKVSWQIDPFGASKEMPSLYAQMGFDGHVYSRGPLPKGEFVWRASEDLNTKIFTTILHNHYGAPDGFNFEYLTDVLNNQNIESKVNQFLTIAKQWNKDYGNTNEVLIPMGGDFNYKVAENWYQNMDRLIKEVKARHSDVDIFYSTPNCYIKAINSLNKTFAERDVDYLTYWVGYYSNRPALKYQDRVTNNILQAAKQLDVLSRLDPLVSKPYLDETRNEVAVMTHHDAITGTSPQHTVNDYTSRLQSGYSAAQEVIKKAYHYLKSKNNSKDFLDEVFCDSLNTSECGFSETNGKIAVTVYNPIARPVSQYIRVPIISADYKVFDSNGKEISEKSILPVSEAVRDLPGRQSNATNELILKAHLPALGFNTYLIERQTKTKKTNAMKRSVNEMKGKSFTLQTDETTGALMSITINGKTHKLHQTFKWYRSMGGVKGMEDSGSYQFCPNGSAIDFGEQKLLSQHSSGSVHELNQHFSDYIKQSVRTYEDEDYIEFDWTVGPIPTGDHIGKEIITRFETDLKTDNVFYTDANGRQTIERKFDLNKTNCNLNVISGNWYPIYSKAYIRDQKQGLQMSVLTDRTQGGSSLNEGELELMVHRRLTNHGEGGDFNIDDPGVDGNGLIVRGKHYLFFQPIERSAQLHRNLSESLYMAPIVSMTGFDTREHYSSKQVITYSSLSHSLPENIHLLTLENWRPNQVLIRLEHMYESSDNNLLTKGVEINLENMFKGFKVLDLVETNLVANQLLSQTKRLKWKSNYFSEEVIAEDNSAVNLTVLLRPQEIRTFILTVENNIHKEDKCTVSWVKSTQTSIPSEAYVAGYDISGNPLNICRAKINSDLVSGKANKHFGCVLTFNDEEIDYKNETNFEVLIANNVQWVQRHGRDPVPEHALVVGQNATKHYTNTYIGRCFTQNSLIVGKIDYRFYYGFNGKEFSDCENHSILVCN